MTRENIKRLLPILTAYAEGKTIQYKTLHGNWCDAECPTWAERTEYRVKPDPIVRYINVYQHKAGAIFTFMYGTQESAEREASYHLSVNSDYSVLKSAHKVEIEI